jgi:hypothetical protein
MRSIATLFGRVDRRDDSSLSNIGEKLVFLALCASNPSFHGRSGDSEFDGNRPRPDDPVEVEEYGALLAPRERAGPWADVDREG